MDSMSELDPSDLPAPLGRDEDHHVFNEVLSQYDAPAYVRRAREVEGALQHLLARCRQQREEWLQMVRTRLGLLRALAGEWSALRPWLRDGAQVTCLEELHAALQPRLRAVVAPTASPRALLSALRALIESIERFNRRWQAFLPTVDLAHINQLRVGYNRYYVLEKECAVRSPQVARQGFQALPPLTVDELTQMLPPLALPQLRA
jgi:hypothetical protein